MDVQVCNISYKTNVTRGPTLDQIKRVYVCMKSKKRVETTNIWIDLNDFVPPHLKKFVKLKHVSVILSSPKEKNEMFSILIIGEKCEYKNKFAFQIIYECLSNDFNMEIEHTPLEVINMVVKSRVESPLLKDFNIMARELKHLCKYYAEKFPQLVVGGDNVKGVPDMIGSNILGDCHTVNISMNRVATSAGVKNVESIPYVTKYVNGVVGLIDPTNTEENVWMDKSMKSDEQIVKSHSIYFTNSFPGSKVTKYFNKSDFQIKKLRYKRYVISNAIVKTGVYPSLDFYLRNAQNIVNMYGVWQLEKWAKLVKPFDL